MPLSLRTQDTEKHNKLLSNIILSHESIPSKHCQGVMEFFFWGGGVVFSIIIDFIDLYVFICSPPFLFTPL